MSKITYTVMVNEIGDKYWYLNGKQHREDGPAVESENGDKFWYLNGKQHRDDGPAVELVDGDKYWYLNGKQHREDGPAIEWVNGDKFWYLNDKQHREDGPAIEYADGTKEWWINGERVTEEEHKRRTTKTLNTTPLEQALQDAWYDGYNAAMERITKDIEIPAIFEFDPQIKRIIESLAKGEE